MAGTGRVRPIPVVLVVLVVAGLAGCAGGGDRDPVQVSISVSQAALVDEPVAVTVLGLLWWHLAGTQAAQDDAHAKPLAFLASQ
jgi:hypothetical protein